MNNKGLFKAKRLSDELAVTGYLFKSYPFTYIITQNAADNACLSGENEDMITVRATRVLEKSVEIVD